MTREEARVKTAELIAACPKWCTEAHYLDAHPEDVRYSRTIGTTSVGSVIVFLHPVKFRDVPQAGIHTYTGQAPDLDMTYDDAMKVADVMVAAAVALKDVKAEAGLEA